jgi:spore germination protein GerM
MKQKPKKKLHKKGRIGKVLLLLIVFGIGISILYLFRQEIFDSIKPWFEKKVVSREKRVVLLYFSDREGEYLTGEKREILKKGEVVDEVNEVINELIKGPRGRLTPTLPPRTRLLGLEIGKNGIAKANFDHTLSKDHPGGSSAEMMTVYSVVNTLTLNFPQIKRVQILIEGEAVDTIAGHLSISRPVPPKLDLIRR